MIGQVGCSPEVRGGISLFSQGRWIIPVEFDMGLKSWVELWDLFQSHQTTHAGIGGALRLECSVAAVTSGSVGVGVSLTLLGRCILSLVFSITEMSVQLADGQQA